MIVKSKENIMLFNIAGIEIFVLNAVYMAFSMLYIDTSLHGIAVSLLAMLLMVSRYYFLFHAKLKDKHRKVFRNAIDILIVFSLILSRLPAAILAPTYGMIIVGAFIAYGKKIGNIIFYVVAMTYTAAMVISAVAMRETLNLERIFYMIAPLAVVYVILIFFIKAIASSDDQSSELRKTNEQLNLKIAEFYTLQYIQNSIASIRDTKKLFEAVNDMIIGVIGPTYSSIVLKKDYEKTDALAEDYIVWATNVFESDVERFLQNDVMMLAKRIAYGKGILCKVKLCGIKLFDDQLMSVIAAPLMIKEKQAGLIVVAHSIEDALSEDFLRLLEVISGNLSIALENTWLYEKLHEMATTDGLTGIYNRMYFNQAIEEEFMKAINRFPISIVICDIDFFKKINDTFGHLFGDKVLKELANIMKSTIRNHDVLARFGGEEFALVLPNADADQAFMVMERLRRKIMDYVFEDKYHSVKVTMSFGIASYPEHGSSVRRILKKADEALYQAKGDGRNCIRKAQYQTKEVSDESLRIGG